MSEEKKQQQKKNPNIWIKNAKIAWFPVACFLALAVGLMAGYSLLGGQPLQESLDFHSLKHLIDLVFAK